MDKAYAFPRNVLIDKQNIGQAIPVSINTSYTELYQSASYDRLRCVYANCLEPVSPVRKDGSDNVVSHFSHRPSTNKPFCPYRSEWREPPTNHNPREREKYQHNIRKLIESRLYEELLRKLPEARISISDDHEREPRIQIDGLARPLLILSIAPHDEWLSKEPFNGTVEGRQVLFFIAGPDIPYLKAKEVNQKLLAKSSAITVYVPDEDGKDFTFKVPGELSETEPASAAPIDQLDLLDVNYQTLFGLDRTSEYLFIKAPQKSPIQFIEQKLMMRQEMQGSINKLQEVIQILVEQFEAQRRKMQDSMNKLQEEKESQVGRFEAQRKEIQDSIKKLQKEKQTVMEQFEAQRREMQDPMNKLHEEAQAAEEVDSTVYAPFEASPGNDFLVLVFAHLPDQAPVLKKIAKEAAPDAEKRVAATLQKRLKRGAELMFNLTIPGLEIDEPLQSCIWQGKLARVQFGVTVPNDLRPVNLIGRVEVCESTIPIGRLRFTLKIVKDASAPIGDLLPAGKMRRYEQAFISYASKDRREVFKRVQMLDALGPRYFVDQLNLKPGAKWEKKLYKYLDESDVVYLFWSKAASKSAWVRKEINYAKQRQAGNDEAPPDIVPIPIQGPPIVKPPPELSYLHFNDKFLYFINPKESKTDVRHKRHLP